jgi:hypothetical protein
VKNEVTTEVLHRVLNHDPLAPKGNHLLKCLEKEPARRYAAAYAVAEDFRRYLEGIPSVARPIGGSGKADRRVWEWRNFAVLYWQLQPAAPGAAPKKLVPKQTNLKTE